MDPAVSIPTPTSPTWADKVQAPAPTAQGSLIPNLGSKKPINAWPDKVRVSSSITRFPLEKSKPVISNGILQVPHDIATKGNAFWQLCLFGFFAGSPLPSHATKSIAMRSWKQYGLESVISDGHFIFRFRDHAGMQAVLDSGPWLFGGRSIILQRWEDFTDGTVKKVPVWARLHQFPYALWTPEGLSLVSSVIGDPVACDQMTHERTGLSFARVCVSITADSPPVKEIPYQIPDKAQSSIQVEYEWLPKRCPKCKVFGHICKDQEQRKEKEKPAASQISGRADGETLSRASGSPDQACTPPVQSPAFHGEGTLPVRLDSQSHSFSDQGKIGHGPAPIRQSKPPSTSPVTTVHGQEPGGSDSGRPSRLCQSTTPLTSDPQPISVQSTEMDTIDPIDVFEQGQDRSLFISGSRFTPLSIDEASQSSSDASPPSPHHLDPVPFRGGRKKERNRFLKDFVLS